MKDNKLIKQFEHKYLLGTESKEEFEKVKDSFDKINTSNIHNSDYSASYKRIKERLDKSISLEDDSRILPKRKFVYIAAASILLVFSLGYFFYHKIYTPFEVSDEIVSNIKPADDKISLLINGKKINLESDSIADLTAKGISHSIGELNFQNSLDTSTCHLIVPKGKQFYLQLSDGTKVWVNANSTLSFPNHFHGNSRQVKLIGEAYFEVASHKNQNFIVETEQHNIEVLGTKFNINSYPENSLTATTLTEGSVKIVLLNNSIMLKPNQQASVYDNGNIITRKVDPEDYNAWKDGYFLFNNASAKEIMDQLCRWYDLEITYKEENDNRERFTGKIPHSTNLADIEKILGNIGITIKVLKKRGTNNFIISN